MNTAKSIPAPLISLAAFIIVIAGMKAASPILVPFLLSLFLAVVATPPMFWLRKRGLPSWLSLLAVVAAIVVLSFGLGAIIGNSFGAFSQDLPQYEARLRELTVDAVKTLEHIGIHVSGSSIRQLLDPGSVMGLAAGVLSGLGSVLTNIFLILLTVVFMLLEAGGLGSKLQTAFPDPTAPLKTFDDVVASINRYVGLKSMVSLATAILIVIWLLIIGVDYPLLWGVLAFFFNFVPNIGSIIAAIPAVLLALVQLGPTGALLTAGGYVGVNVLIGSVIEPRLMGRSLGISPLIVFLSLVFWGWVLGPVGMLLSVPLTMIAQIGLAVNDRTRWLAVLMGPEPHAQVKPGSPADDEP